jgi:ribosome recycling factor
MNPNDIITQAKTKFQGTVTHFEEELKKLRTGRAHGGMLDSVMVEAYGTPMPLNQLANVTAPEAQLLQITPFDPGNLAAISAAIRDNQSLGLNPSDDGHIIRIQIPALTEERRREITKQVSGKLEDCMIALRGTRHETLDTFNEAKKDKDLGEDEVKRLSQQVEELMTQAKNQAEAAAKAKEHEIMTV